MTYQMNIFFLPVDLIIVNYDAILKQQPGGISQRQRQNTRNMDFFSSLPPQTEHPLLNRTTELLFYFALGSD